MNVEEVDSSYTLWKERPNQKEQTMSDNLRRYRAIREALTQGYPGELHGRGVPPDSLVSRPPVWHDTCGGCHSSSAPSGLVALSREYTMSQPLQRSFQNGLNKVSGSESYVNRRG